MTNEKDELSYVPEGFEELYEGISGGSIAKVTLAGRTILNRHPVTVINKGLSNDTIDKIHQANLSRPYSMSFTVKNDFVNSAFELPIYECLLCKTNSERKQTIVQTKKRAFSPTKSIAYNEYILRLHPNDKLPRISKKKINKKFKQNFFLDYNSFFSGSQIGKTYLFNTLIQDKTKQDLIQDKIKKQFFKR